MRDAEDDSEMVVERMHWTWPLYCMADSREPMPYDAWLLWHYAILLCGDVHTLVQSEDQVVPSRS